LHTGPSVDFHDGDGFFVVRFAYDLAIYQPATQGNDSETGSRSAKLDIASIKFEYAALYSLDLAKDDVVPKAEELEAYAATMVIWRSILSPGNLYTTLRLGWRCRL
jgi:hypothetical protein